MLKKILNIHGTTRNFRTPEPQALYPTFLAVIELTLDATSLEAVVYHWRPAGLAAGPTATPHRAAVPLPTHAACSRALYIWPLYQCCVTTTTTLLNTIGIDSLLIPIFYGTLIANFDGSNQSFIQS